MNTMDTNQVEMKKMGTIQKTLLLDKSEEALTQMMKEFGQPAFRGSQIYSWLHKGISRWDEMVNVPRQLRKKLEEDYDVGFLKIKDKLVSSDGTVKYLFELADGNMIESVRMVYSHGVSVCISSQVGCKMGCDFCASAKAGFMRNLTPGEMMNQVLTILHDTKERIGNIVLMGIGEPFDNYDNVIQFIKLVNDKKGLNIGYRKITISTCGLVPEIQKFTRENMQVNLSVSLHSPNNDIRDKMMPVNKAFPIDKLIKTCKIYTEVTGRRMTFEYAMIDGVNDSQEEALELVRLLRGMLCHVNLIPVNTIKDGKYSRANQQNIYRFKEILVSHRIPVSLRRVLGNDIEAACGQLRRNQIVGEMHE